MAAALILDDLLISHHNDRVTNFSVADVASDITYPVNPSSLEPAAGTSAFVDSFPIYDGKTVSG